MKRAAGLVLLWTVIVIGAFVADAYLRTPVRADGEIATIERHLTGQLTKAAERRRFGSAALVLLRNGEVVAARGFGVANAKTGAPVNPDRALYQVASVSKAVTAWGVMKLVQEGKLGLDEPVMPHLRRWRFPGSDAYRDKVTVRHLLTHTAGLDDGLGYGGFAPGQRVQTLEESLTLTKDSTVGEPRRVIVAREPGKSFAYSGGGYAVLQLLIEEVTGQPFSQYMNESVLQPLGMTRSHFDVDAIIAEGRAQDLATGYDGDLQPQPPRRYSAKAAVALYATPQDLARWCRAFVTDNPVLSRATLDQMMTPQPATSGSWGLGHTLFAPNVVGHVGGTYPAWGAMVRVNRVTGNGMVLVISGGRGATNQLGHDWLYWDTGQVTAEARRQRLYDRIVPASVVIVAGAIAIVLWCLRRAAKGAIVLACSTLLAQTTG